VTSLINIGLIHFDRGRYLEALKFSQQALTLAQELGTRQTEATALNNIGTVLLSTEQLFRVDEVFRASIGDQQRDWRSQ
jgi:tetratricopeptide (TPR) repeat protein